jgi:2-keto-myo-inositol isomerase
MEIKEIGINLVTLKDGNDADKILENLDYVSEAGFKGVGLWLSMLSQWKKTGRSIGDLNKEIRNRNLKVYEICYVPILDDNGNLMDHRMAFEIAKELDAPQVISLYTDFDATIDKARKDWEAFVKTVEDIGVKAAFEFIGMWKKYNTPLEAWEIIRNSSEIGTIVFDTFHFWRGGGAFDQIDEIPCGRVSLVHLNDVKNVPREKAEDIDRTYPGEGIIPLKDTINRLLANGFTGLFSVEIFGEVQKRDPQEVCQHAFKSADRLIKSFQ